MMKTYPKMPEYQFKALPQVFQEVIKWDNRKPSIPRVIKFRDIKLHLEALHDWKVERDKLTAGCQNVIKQQRGN